jgi:putative ubiquitin-RnfH superfamily antitoxin RatB of RatAB toxin-antitoxin module
MLRHNQFIKHLKIQINTGINAEGIMLRESEINNLSTILDITALPVGIYFARIVTNNNLFIKKINTQLY